MKILICDDDPRIIEELKEHIEEYFITSGQLMPQVDAYLSGDDLLSGEQSFDIVFLDVEMPGKSGIHVGREIMKKNPLAKVMILTSYPEYLDDAMEFRVFRYLSKPIDKARLFKNLSLAIKRHMEDAVTVDIKTKDSIITCNTNDIIAVKYSNRKTIVYTTNGEAASIYGIDHWKNTLTMPCFYETHRSYIVNMKYIKKIEKTSVTLVHEGKEIVAYLTARKYTRFVDSYLQYRGRNM